MKAISIWQPYATAMFLYTLTGDRIKRIETRSWSTKYRGQLLIHAAKTFPKVARDFAISELVFGRFPAKLPFGAIIGIVNLVDIKRTEDVVQEISVIERLYGNYSTGRHAWITDSFRAFENPIPYKGQQRFFDVPDELIKEAIL